MGLTRRTPLKRTPMKRSRSRLKPVNPARRKAEFARSYGSKERVAYVRSLRCIVPACQDWTREECDNAHIRGGGASRKADADQVVPMCRRHHREMHTLGSRTFAHVYRVDLTDAAALTEAAWQSFTRNRTP